MFYQWNPHGTEHKHKCWGHVVSDDLTHWRRKGIALEPSEWYDKDGIYSGGSVVHDGRLYLFYTGNVIRDDGVKASYQCAAVPRTASVSAKSARCSSIPPAIRDMFGTLKYGKTKVGAGG
ncbi:hypothetical protein HMSSN036_16700 [Paenibacillus macerans]|nr:hypothetical protein HMSSN036_16700 [Paenibacillus macerans]